MVFPLLGLLGGGAVTSALGGMFGGGGAAGLMKGLLSGGGLGGMLSKLLGGGGPAGGQGGPEALLGDIKNMLTQLVEGMGPQNGSGCQGSSHSEGPHQSGGSHGGGSGGDWKPHDGGSHGDGHGGCEGSSKPKPMPEKPEGGCGCDDAGGAEWDGEDKSPSMDREQAAKRFLEQAKQTDDPEQKRELIKMALDMLGGGEHGGGSCGQDGNSYDKDIVKQAEKMMDSIDDSNLNGCNAGKAMDSVIDMLMGEGGVDGKPAGNDHDGDGRGDRGPRRGGGLYHLHDHQTMHR